MVKRFKEIREYKVKKSIEVNGREMVKAEERHFFNESLFWNDRGTEATRAILRCLDTGEKFLVSLIKEVIIRFCTDMLTTNEGQVGSKK